MGSVVVAIAIVLEVLYFFYHQRFRSTLTLMSKLQKDSEAMRLFLHFQMGRLVCTVLFSFFVFFPLVILSWAVPIWYTVLGTPAAQAYAVPLLVLAVISLIVGNVVTQWFKLSPSHWSLVLKSYAVTAANVVLLILLLRAL